MPSGRICFTTLNPELTWLLIFVICRWEISPLANIFARGSRERAPIALLAKCELPQKRICFCGVYLTRGTKRKNHTDWCGFRFGDPWENFPRPSRLPTRKRRANVANSAPLRLCSCCRVILALNQDKKSRCSSELNP